jgi:hypothetical protein
VSFNYNKWGFILGTGIALATLVASVSIPEFRCFLGLKSESCPIKDELVNVKLIVETEDGKSLEGVEVSFLSINGAPEIKTTNSDGYVQIRIPSTVDIDVKLSKEGFQTLTRTINLGTEPDKTKTYRLKNSVSTSRDRVNPPPTTPNNPPPSLEQSVSSCTLVSGYGLENYSQDISVSRQSQKTEGRIMLYEKSPHSETCRITQNTGILTKAYAIPDNSRLQQVRISFYLNGSLFKSLYISHGSVLTVTLPLKNTSSYAIECQLISGGYDHLYTIPISGN